MAKVKRAFEYIRKMIRIWIRDCEIYENEEAEVLLHHFHKWLTTRKNALYDPLLSRMIN
jgi:hypothetical protein